MTFGVCCALNLQLGNNSASVLEGSEETKTHDEKRLWGVKVGGYSALYFVIRKARRRGVRVIAIAYLIYANTRV